MEAKAKAHSERNQNTHKASRLEWYKDVLQVADRNVGEQIYGTRVRSEDQGRLEVGERTLIEISLPLDIFLLF